jgi:hypothetical protein
MSQQQLFYDAVRIVTQEISPESARIIQYAIENNKTEAFGIEQGSFGVAFRNLLADRGVVWEESIQFAVWFAVLQQSVLNVLE